jgi:glycosyltransferase involved in cell wall biosynthesis
MIDVVSVVIPHYNADRFLGEAISSVYAQGVIVKELIVVDDGSSEESWKRARDLSSASAPFTEMWIRCSMNHGQGHALNLGAHAATGDYIAFLDADDVWTAGKLRKQLAAWKAHPLPAPREESMGYSLQPIVFGHAENFGAQTTEAKPAPLMSALFMPAAYARREKFREDLGAGMTLEWFSRMEGRGVPIIMLPDLVFYRRIHDQNYGVVHRERAQKEYLDALKIVSDRKKRASDPK